MKGKEGDINRFTNQDLKDLHDKIQDRQFYGKRDVYDLLTTDTKSLNRTGDIPQSALEQTIGDYEHNINNVVGRGIDPEGVSRSWIYHRNDVEDTRRTHNGISYRNKAYVKIDVETMVEDTKRSLDFLQHMYNEATDKELISGGKIAKEFHNGKKRTYVNAKDSAIVYFNANHPDPINEFSSVLKGSPDLSYIEIGRDVGQKSYNKLLSQIVSEKIQSEDRSFLAFKNRFHSSLENARKGIWEKNWKPS